LPLDLNAVRKRLIYFLSGDLGSSERPYLELAAKLDLTEREVLSLIDDVQRIGVIRRLGAVVVHQRSGFRANAMVVWEVPESGMDQAGHALARLSYVSHCYWRPSVECWPYNLYTMIHAQNTEELSAMIGEMVSLTGAAKWKVLESVKELKKTSLQYFHESM
jgi:DNA-binding Lrp family transcriptional regulator